MCIVPNSLRSHGTRERKVRLSAALVVVIYVARLLCGACGKALTVLPSFMHPYRRYALEVIQPVVVLRHGEQRSYRAIERALVSPAPSTQREWSNAWAASSATWLSSLGAWFAKMNPKTTLDRLVEGGSAAGLLATALHFCDWLIEFEPGRRFSRDKIVESLWLWGARHVGEVLIHPTRCRAGPQRCGLPIS